MGPRVRKFSLLIGLPLLITPEMAWAQSQPAPAGTPAASTAAKPAAPAAAEDEEEIVVQGQRPRGAVVGLDAATGERGRADDAERHRPLLERDGHRLPLVNGYSGNVPDSYIQWLRGMKSFPGQAAIEQVTAGDVAKGAVMGVGLAIGNMVTNMAMAAPMAILDKLGQALHRRAVERRIEGEQPRRRATTRMARSE